MRTPTRAVKRLSRGGEIRRLMRKLEWDGYPRLQMLFLVALTGAAGMFASFCLLQAGITSMAIRYPAAVLLAYLVFLLLLWAWLRTKADDYIDPGLDVPLPDLPAGAGRSPDLFRGQGGEHGGGGASGKWELDSELPKPDLPDLGGAKLDAVGDVVGGADEGAVPLFVVLLIAIAVLALFGSALYVVYLAPALFAELLVDGALSASLYRRLRGLQTRHWLESALRRTVLPFLVTAVALAAAGLALQVYLPEAKTLGQVIGHARR